LSYNCRDAVCVIGGAVQGVDYPTGLALAIRFPTFFGQHPVVREGLPEDLLDLPLGLFVGLGDEVRLPLVADLVSPTEAAPQHLAGAAVEHVELRVQIFDEGGTCRSRMLTSSPSRNSMRVPDSSLTVRIVWSSSF
jgi:hypothetical protein